MTTEAALVDRFLAHLGLERSAPDRELLGQLVARHQRRVPFETLTKIVDWQRLRGTGTVLPTMEDYIERIVTRGAGGTCWTLARGFHWLVTQLGFEASFMYMDPGHLCVRVELDRPYYADVGYAAPLFDAYPLCESFTAHDPRERFDYQVQQDKIVVTREPGPEKVLDPTPRSFDEFEDRVAAANRWEPGSFLLKLAIVGHIGETPVRLRDDTLTRFSGDDPAETLLSDPEIHNLLASDLGLDPSLYFEARAIRDEQMRANGLP